MKAVLIGGTGTLGKALAKRIDADEVVIFSRDECKQQEMKSIHPSFQYVIGDVRDAEAVGYAVKGAQSVFLLAAMKHIDVCEQNPLEAIKTNVQGAINVANACFNHKVKYSVYSNTDKAILPITTYGYTKALAQDYFLSKNGTANVNFSSYLWGNVAASRGSAITTFLKSIYSTGIVGITDERMSRFWIRIEDAAKFVLSTYKDTELSPVRIPPIKGATVIRVTQSLCRLIGVEHKYVITGLRGVEKMYEVLESSHNHCLRSDTCEQYTDHELDMLLAPIVRDYNA